MDDSGGTPVDVRNDTTNFSFSTPRAVQDTTGVDKSAFERLLLLADFTGQLNTVFNVSVGHTVFRTVSSTSVQRTITLGIAGVSLPNECLLTDYQFSRGQDGALTNTVPFTLANGTAPTWA